MNGGGSRHSGEAKAPASSDPAPLDKGGAKGILRRPTKKGQQPRGVASATATEPADGAATAAPSKPPHMEHWSFGIFSPTNPLRRAAQGLVSNSIFDSFILLCIFVNCLFMAMNEPAAAPDYSSDETMDALLRAVDFVFTGIFSVEMLCKLVALGLAFHPGAYLRSPWNWLDGVVVIFSVLGLIPATQELVNGVGALRTIRLLRPLRTVNRVEGMRITVQALISATPRLMHVAMLCGFCFFVFGIVGVQLFSGTLRNRCHTAIDGEVPGPRLCPPARPPARPLACRGPTAPPRPTTARPSPRRPYTPPHGARWRHTPPLERRRRGPSGL